MHEISFDGLVGPTHTYAGLSPGNLAAERHAGAVANPRAAALQGLAKMRQVHGLGVLQGVLPPHPRPDVDALRRQGFAGSDAQVLAAAARTDGGLPLHRASSASAMWAANAATVAPSCDTSDGRVHFTPANLSFLPHRALEAPVTTRVLRAIFADASRFVVHDPVQHPGDEGAANHLRLATDRAVVHLFAWGRADDATIAQPARHAARQSREASAEVARLHGLGARALLWQQSPAGIDAGAFHTDVLATSNENVALIHERAFVDGDRLAEALRARLGDPLELFIVRESELSCADAVAKYPFNSQLVTLPSGEMALLAPSECREHEATARFFQRVLTHSSRVKHLHFVDVESSMKNGGGPACLRLRVALTTTETDALAARVVVDESLLDELEAWVCRHYRDRLTPADLADPALLQESRSALDELTSVLGLGSIYDFQRAPSLVRNFQGS